MGKKFFAVATEQSKAKARIITEYFTSWASIMVAVQKRWDNGKVLNYIDLYAGKGRYDDGTLSTPLMILQKIMDNPDFCERVQCIFNDAAPENTKQLEDAINSMPGIERLRFKPQVLTGPVSNEIVRQLEATKMAPTFFFIDPFGYVGLSLRLINAMLKRWGSDGVFFFNYNRINMGISNSKVTRHMEALFGKERVKAMKAELHELGPISREKSIKQQLKQALRDLGAHHPVPFCFKKDGRTSHYLIAVSKDFKGHEKAKEAMAKESSFVIDGVPNYEFWDENSPQPSLLETRPIDKLAELLLKKYSGRTMTMQEIYEKHSAGRKYLKSNYKKALCSLKEKGKIDTVPATLKANTFADHVKVTFPGRSDGKIAN